MVKLSHKIQDLMKSSAYQNSSHPNHKKTVSEVDNYFQKAFKGEATQDISGQINSSQTVYKWLSSVESCKYCQSMDEKIFESLNELKNIHPAHPNCKCEIVEVIESNMVEDNITRKTLQQMAKDVSIALDGSISHDGVIALMQEEAVRKQIYDDGKNNPTIGIGHKLREFEKESYKGKVLSYDEIKNLLISDLKSPVQSVKNINAKMGVNLEQHQKDALTSHIFNRGSNNWTQSTLYDLLINQTDINLKAAFLDNAKDQPKNVKNGLTARYTNEYNIFDNGIYLKKKIDIK